MTLPPSSSRELHIDVETEEVFEVKGVPVKRLHQDDVGVAEHSEVNHFERIFVSTYFSLQGPQFSQTGFQCSFIILVILFIVAVLGDSSPT